MSVIRRSRVTGIAGVVAMAMAVLSVCPCPEMATSSPEDVHRCCDGKDALTASPTCCLDEASDPQLADARVTPPPTAGWAALHAIVCAAPAPPVPSPVIVAVPLVAAPPILRI